MAWGVFFRHFCALTQKGFTLALKKQNRFLTQLWFDKRWARFENAQKCLILTKSLFLNKNFVLIDTSVILSTGVTGGGLAYRLKSGAANQQPSAVE